MISNTANINLSQIAQYLKTECYSDRNSAVQSATITRGASSVRVYGYGGAFADNHADVYITLSSNGNTMSINYSIYRMIVTIMVFIYY